MSGRVVAWRTVKVVETCVRVREERCSSKCERAVVEEREV
jgi:hypothetical protein